MIKGGYILKPRVIKNSDISDCAPCVRETWDYLIREANHKDFKANGLIIKRGELFRTYDEILDSLSWRVGWRKETYTKNQMKQCMKILRESQRITTQKKPGGVLITICNYDTYQDPSNYEQTTEETSEQTIDKPSTNHRQTSHIYKNEKNVNNEKNDTPSVSKNRNDQPLLGLSKNDFDMKSKDKDEMIDRLTFKIFELMREAWTDNISHIKKATIKKWRDHVRKMHTQDGLALEEIYDLTVFALEDEFWGSTISSTSGLRKNLGELQKGVIAKKKKKTKIVDFETKVSMISSQGYCEADFETIPPKTDGGEYRWKVDVK